MLTLLEALKHIRDNGPKHPSLGICGNLLDDELEDEFTGLALCWPRFSGLLAFPVPHPDMSADERIAIPIINGKASTATTVESY